MQVFDPKDKDSIYWGLNAVFQYDNKLINKKIAEQVLCIGGIRDSGIVLLTRNLSRWPMQSTLVRRNLCSPFFESLKAAEAPSEDNKHVRQVQMHVKRLCLT